MTAPHTPEPRVCAFVDIDVHFSAEPFGTRVLTGYVDVRAGAVRRTHLVDLNSRAFPEELATQIHQATITTSRALSAVAETLLPALIAHTTGQIERPELARLLADEPTAADIAAALHTLEGTR